MKKWQLIKLYSCAAESVNGNFSNLAVDQKQSI